MLHIYDATDVLDRFLRYVQVPTASSDSHADQVPSTPEQLVLARLLAKELSELGIADAEVTEHGYVVGHLPASAGADERPALGLIAHLDTTDVVSGEGVAPHIVHYEGGALVSGTGMNGPVQLEPEQYPQLTELVGEDLVVSDGSTLLGADDKAGIAEIMALVAHSLPIPSFRTPLWESASAQTRRSATAPPCSISSASAAHTRIRSTAAPSANSNGSASTHAA